MTIDDERGEGGKKCPKFDDVICERPLIYNPVKKLVLDIQSGKTGISMLSYENFGKSMSRTRTKITFVQHLKK